MRLKNVVKKVNRELTTFEESELKKLASNPSTEKPEIYEGAFRNYLRIRDVIYSLPKAKGEGSACVYGSYQYLKLNNYIENENTN